MTPISNAEKRERLNRLSEEEWLRFSYVPFVVAEGAWDYADSVINIAAQMRLPQTKKLSRAVRELKRSYDGYRQRHALTKNGFELENFQSIEGASKASLKYMYSRIKDSIQRTYPDLEEEYRMLVTAVYACLTILEILFKYMAKQEEHVCEVCGFSSISSILPSELTALRTLIPEFAGDKKIKVKGLGLFVYNIVRSLCYVRLTSVKSEVSC